MSMREERLKRGWSLTRLSGLTGIAASDLSQVERGLRFVHPGWRRRISRALGIPMNELFPDTVASESTVKTTRNRKLGGSND